MFATHFPQREAGIGKARGLIAHLFLSLLLIVQLAGPLGCATPGQSRAGSDLLDVSQALGLHVAICHHGEPDKQPASDDGGGCCACILCHAAASCALSSKLAVDAGAPTSFVRVAFLTPPVVDGAKPHFVGSSGPRGPPLSI